jgi:hypothetical protein
MARVRFEGGIDLRDSQLYQPMLLDDGFTELGERVLDSAEMVGQVSYRKHSDGVDGKPILIAVTHDCWRLWISEDGND